MESDQEAQVFADEADGGVAAEAMAHALALLDEGRIAEARELLAQALEAFRYPAGPAPCEVTSTPEDEGDELGRVGDAELESAFGAARPETDSMIDADGIAFEAMRQARLDEPESVALPDPDSPFHTRTLADLLERQGDIEGAWAIRAALAGGEDEAALDEPSFPGHDSTAATLRTLERWLARLRGDDR